MDEDGCLRWQRHDYTKTQRLRSHFKNILKPLDPSRFSSMNSLLFHDVSSSGWSLFAVLAPSSVAVLACWI